MPFEVEQKHQLLDVGAALETLARLGAEPLEQREQSDRYFSHPARDFRLTDEALRVRRQGHCAWLTYKGPKLDAQTKTRLELETPFALQDCPTLAETLRALGFAEVLEVRKSRQPYRFAWRERMFEVSLDRVEGVGQYMEFETAVERLEQLTDAQRDLLDLARRFDLGPVERRSYLELLIGHSP